MLRIPKRAFVSATIAISLLYCSAAHAQLTAEPLPGDPRLVVFNFDANNSYRVFTKPLTVTHVVLQPDERVKYLALGDTDSWLTSKKDNHLFIKPKKDGISTSGTLLTNKREYQFTLISTGDSGRWYQRVSFEYPSDLVIAAIEEDERALLAEQSAASSMPGVTLAQGGRTAGADRSSQESREAGGDSAPDLAKLNFRYEVVGEANFKPITIYDNGEETHIKLPEDASVPALFTIVDGEAEMIDYTHRAPGSLVVPRAMAAGLLKIGPREVRFYNLTKMRKTWGGNYVERSK